MEKKGSGWVWVLIALLFLGLLGSMMGDSDYEKAGKSYGSWVSTDPKTWTTTQKNFYNNFNKWKNNR